MKDNSQIAFFAMLHRMKYIERWGLMRNTEKENLKEHTFDVILLAHALTEIRQIYFPELKPQLDPGQVALFALYHDASEIITGDLPTPVKYFNPEMRGQYAEVEHYAENYLLSLLTPELKQQYEKYFFGSDDSEREKIYLEKIVKQADRLAAYIKCIAEIKQGNNEFVDAAETTKEKLLQFNSPELDWFLQHVLPSYELSLDQLQPY